LGLSSRGVDFVYYSLSRLPDRGPADAPCPVRRRDLSPSSRPSETRLRRAVVAVANAGGQLRHRGQSYGDRSAARVAHPAAYPFDYYPSGPGGALIIEAPGAAALIGLIELCTGTAFHQIEEAWAKLTGWQRFVGGTLIVVFGGAIAFAGVAALFV